MLSPSQRVIPQPAALAPQLIVFEGGGTLIDFHGMWSEWVIELARRLKVATGNPVAGRLFRAMGFDSRARRIAHGGRLAMTPMGACGH